MVMVVMMVMIIMMFNEPDGRNRKRTFLSYASQTLLQLAFMDPSSRARASSAPPVLQAAPDPRCGDCRKRLGPGPLTMTCRCPPPVIDLEAEDP